VDEIGGHHALISVLASTEVDEVTAGWIDGLTDPYWSDRQLVSSPRQSLGEHGDVPSVAVNVHLVGVQVTEANVLH